MGFRRLGSVTMGFTAGMTKAFGIEFAVVRPRRVILRQRVVEPSVHVEEPQNKSTLDELDLEILKKPRRRERSLYRSRRWQTA